MQRSETETLVLVASTRPIQTSGEDPARSANGRDKCDAHTHSPTGSHPKKAAAPELKPDFRTKAIVWVAAAMVTPMVLGVLAAAIITAL